MYGFCTGCMVKPDFSGFDPKNLGEICGNTEIAADIATENLAQGIELQFRGGFVDVDEDRPNIIANIIVICSCN